MKKVIVLQHNGGRLANQLWLFISVYAYCLEKGYVCFNHTFFEYARYFNVYPNGALLIRLFSKLYSFFEIAIPSLRRYYRFIFRRLYSLFVYFIKIFKKSEIIFAEKYESPSRFFIPPSGCFSEEISRFDTNIQNKIYLVGWLFRNPSGIEKFRDEIKKYFRPRDRFIIPIEREIKNLRNSYNKIIGVHIRQGDYQKIFKGGDLCLSEHETFGIIKEYIDIFNVDVEKTCFLVFSDGAINPSEFPGIHMKISKNKVDIQDLFELSMTDAIIGSDSTFGAFASYYGNIPFIIMKKEGMDWEYYKDKKSYFENKYSTTVKY